MLQAGVRASDAPLHYNRYPSTKQLLRECYQVGETVKDRRRSGQPKMTTRR